MAVNALIKFTQNAVTPGAGIAMYGSTGLTVSVANTNTTSIGSWQIDLVYTPPGSAVPVATPLAFSDNGNTPAASFVPDVRGSYRVVLKLWSAINRVGVPDDTDIRVFGVKEAGGLLVLPAQDYPSPLPSPASGLAGNKPSETNFNGQAFGWAGSGSDGLASEMVKRADAAASAYGAELGQAFEWDTTNQRHMLRRKPVTPNIDLDGNTDIGPAVNAALASRPGVHVQLPEPNSGKKLKLTTPIVMTQHSSALTGRGCRDGGSTLLLSGAANQFWITASDLEGICIENIRGERDTASLTGAGYFMKIARCGGARITSNSLRYGENGLWLDQNNNIRVYDFIPRNCFGTRSIRVSGETDYGAQTYIEGLFAEHGGPPLGYPASFSAGMLAAWTTGESVSTGYLRSANAGIWQATNGGTTAASGTGPAALPNTDPVLARSQTVNDNGVLWKFVGNWFAAGLFCNSYCGDVTIKESAMLNGGLGIELEDATYPGHPPAILNSHNVAIDHPAQFGMLINAGKDVHLRGGECVSCLGGPGITVAAVLRRWDLQQISVFGNAKEGIGIAANDGFIQGCEVGNNSQKTSNGFDGILLNVVRDVSIVGGRSGAVLDGSSTCAQRYGVNIITGSTYYGVGGPINLRGNTTGALFHPSGTGASIGSYIS